MIRINLLFLFGIITTLSFSQSLENFTGLKSAGPVPEDFITLSSQKYEADLEANENDALDKDFFLSTRFIIDELLLSGNVLFNDPLSDYVKDVAKYVLQHENGLYEKLRFYVLKSNTVNAFSTDQGIIFVTTALLSQLENEAQLGFILCHEISHYTEHHVQNSYVERQDILKGKNQYRTLSYSKRVKKLSTYSKETELEADTKGIDIYLKSDYAVDEIVSAFGVLLYSYLPFGDVEFDENYFNTDVMVVPAQLFPDTIQEITREEDYDDEGSTHPNIKTRIDKAIDYLDDDSSRGELLFKISQERFKQVRSLARFENLNVKLRDREYASAIYDIFMLQKYFPDNKFLKLSLVKALYGIMKYKNHTRYNEVKERLKNIEGESYRLHAFANELSDEQISVMAFRKVYDLMQEYPEDPLVKKYHDDIKFELAVHSRIDINKFSDKPYLVYRDSVEELSSSFNIEDSIKRVDESDLSKYKKLKLKKELRELLKTGDMGDNSEEFHYFALYDLVAEHNLVKELKSIKSDYEDSNDEDLEDYIYLDDRFSHNLGIDSIVIVDPFFEVKGVSGKSKLKKSEDKKIILNQMYLEDYPKLDLERQLIDSKDLTQLDVDKYNSLATLNQWVEEVAAHEELDMIASSHNRMEDVKNAYGTSNFLFSGVSLYKTRKEFTSTHFLGILFIYTIPIVALDLLITHHYIDYTAILVDADNDRIVYVENIDVNNRGTNNNMNFLIYHVLHNINSKETK